MNDTYRWHSYPSPEDRIATQYMPNGRNGSSTNQSDDLFASPFVYFDSTPATLRDNLTKAPWTRLRTKIRNSSETVMVFEGNAQNLSFASRLAARHGRKARNGLTNLLYFDGHVSTTTTEPFDKADLAQLADHEPVGGVADSVSRRSRHTIFHP